MELVIIWKPDSELEKQFPTCAPQTAENGPFSSAK